MKSLIMKSLMVLVFVAGIGNYLVYLKTGQMPLLAMRDQFAGKSPGDFLPRFSADQLASDAREAAHKVANQLSNEEPAPEVKVYKWTDAEGRVHFSDKPQSQNAQQITVDTRNTLSPTSTQPATHSANETAAGDTASPLEKARAAADAMNRRAAQQEQGY